MIKRDTCEKIITIIVWIIDGNFSEFPYIQYLTRKWVHYNEVFTELTT